MYKHITQALKESIIILNFHFCLDFFLIASSQNNHVNLKHAIFKKIKPKSLLVWHTFLIKLTKKT